MGREWFADCSRMTASTPVHISRMPIYQKREQPPDQQQGGMSVSEFAALHNLTPRRVLTLISKHRIIGVSRHPLSGKCTIFPPAKIVDI